MTYRLVVTELTKLTLHPCHIEERGVKKELYVWKIFLIFALSHVSLIYIYIYIPPGQEFFNSHRNSCKIFDCKLKPFIRYIARDTGYFYITR